MQFWLRLFNSHKWSVSSLDHGIIPLDFQWFSAIPGWIQGENPTSGCPKVKFQLICSIWQSWLSLIISYGVVDGTTRATTHRPHVHGHYVILIPLFPFFRHLKFAQQILERVASTCSHSILWIREFVKLLLSSWPQADEEATNTAAEAEPKKEPPWHRCFGSGVKATIYGTDTDISTVCNIYIYEYIFVWN